MSNPTVSQVRTWVSNAHFLTEAATGLDTAVDTFDTEMNAISRNVATTMGSWQGDAAEASQARTDAEKQASSRLAITILDIVDDINRLGPDLVHAALVARDRAATIAGLGYVVADNGTVTAPPDVRPGHPTDVPAGVDATEAKTLASGKAAEHQSFLAEALSTAGQADATLAAEIIKTLGELVPNADRATTDLPLSPAVQDIVDGKRELPADPQALNIFWDGLTSAEKAALWNTDHAIGNREGIPVVDRDHFNRKRLAELELAGGPHVAGLLAVQDTLGHEVDGRKRYLMQLDGNGHAAVAVNNPDTADNIVTYVPGTGSKLTNIGGGVDRADRMIRSAKVADASADTAAIAWFGYDAPPELFDAGKGHFASRGAQPLIDLQNSLRVTHEGATPSHNTVVSHSYGTVVTAEAASGHRELDADDVVFVASPGLGGPGDVGDLNLSGPDDRPNSERVWATVAGNDVINLVEVVHGADPTDRGFGAHQFESEGGSGISTAAHGKYWDDHSISLENMGRIIAGRYGEVQ